MLAFIYFFIQKFTFLFNLTQSLFDPCAFSQLFDGTLLTVLLKAFSILFFFPIFRHFGIIFLFFVIKKADLTLLLD